MAQNENETSQLTDFSHIFILEEKYEYQRKSW